MLALNHLTKDVDSCSVAIFFSSVTHHSHLYHSTYLEICNSTVLPYESAYHMNVISNIRKYTSQDFQPQFRDVSGQ